jgi:hypothetical protein
MLGEHSAWLACRLVLAFARRDCHPSVVEKRQAYLISGGMDFQVIRKVFTTMNIRAVRIGRTLIVGAIVLAVIGGGLFWLEHRDPLASLSRPEHDFQVDRVSVTLRADRKIQHFILHTKELGDIGVIVSLPEPLPRYKLPVLVVLGGLGSGEDNIRYVPDAGDNAVVGYDWPMPVHPGATTILTHLPSLYRDVMSIPAQVGSALYWVNSQPWADDKSMSVLGFSLGALAAPAIEDVAEHDGRKIGWTVLAYGGDPFGALLAANPNVRPGYLRPVLAPLIDVLLAPLEPDRHLPRLTGEFLVLQGENDALVPQRARARFRDAVPEPKTVTTFPGDHMGVGPGKAGLLQQIIDTSKSWLIDKGAIMPFQ